MDLEQLYNRVETMIHSSTKNPKFMSISTVKVADIFGVKPQEIEEGLQQLVNAGRLTKTKMEKPPNFDVYSLPEM